MWNTVWMSQNVTYIGPRRSSFHKLHLFLGLAILAILMHFATTSTATSLFVSAFSAQNRGPRCLSRVGRFSTLTIPTVLASRTQPLESTLRELLDLEKLQLAYIGTAGTAPRKDSDRPLKDQRKKRRYEARYQCKMLGEIFSASSAQHIFLEDFPQDGGGPKKLTAALESALGTDGNGVLFVDGGNTFWLQFHAKKAGLATALREVRSATRFAYVGVSAGAILAGPTCDTAYWKGWDDPLVVPQEAREASLDGLGLVEPAVFPHHGPQWEETVERCSKTLPPDSKLLTLTNFAVHPLTQASWCLVELDALDRAEELHQELPPDEAPQGFPQARYAMRRVFERLQELDSKEPLTPTQRCHVQTLIKAYRYRHELDHGLLPPKVKSFCKAQFDVSSKVSSRAMLAFSAWLLWGLTPVTAEPEGIGAAELEKKFVQLKALAEKEGKSADPDFLRTMEDLKKQLEALKEGQEQLQKAKEEAARSRKATSHEDNAWVAACFAMSTETLGGSLSKDDFHFIERFAEENLTLEEAAELPLFRMATVCLGKRLDEDEVLRTTEMLKHVTMGRKPPPLPQEWVEESERDATKEQVRHLSPWAFGLLKMQAEGAVYNSKWYNRGPPSFFLILALPVPLYYAVLWVLEKWRGRSAAAPKEIKARPEPSRKCFEEQRVPRMTERRQ
eukprot:symbB.v1.2.022067.t1/scaffold1943.1/size95470/1